MTMADRRLPFPEDEAELREIVERAVLAGVKQALTEERAAVRPLLVDLMAFVDGRHDFRAGACHYDWCEACKVLARVPADVVAEARQVLRERGVDRD